MQKFGQIYSAAGFLSLLLSVANCSTPPVQKAIFTPAERVQIENRRGALISAEFEKSLVIRHSVEITLALRKTALRLMEKMPLLKDSPIGILLVSKSLRSYAIPGIRLYLSIPMLKRLHTENEVAALIAWQIAHVWKRHPMGNLELLRDEQAAIRHLPEMPFEEVVFDFTGPRGILQFSESQYQEALEGAVELLYRSGYDSRGLVSVLQSVQNSEHGSAQSKMKDESSPVGEFSDRLELARLVEKVRLKIMSLSPVRHPIVDTPEFAPTLKRIKKL